MEYEPVMLLEDQEAQGENQHRAGELGLVLRQIYSYSFILSTRTAVLIHTLLLNVNIAK